MAQLMMSYCVRRSSSLINYWRSSTLVVQKANFCVPASQQTTKVPDTDINKGTHKVNEFEKKLLVWFGKYKTAEEIPGYVSQDKVERVRNKFRIRVANIMMALTFLGCGLMIFKGRKAVERGESVLKMNQDWHKEYNEKAQAEALEKVAQSKQ